MTSAKGNLRNRQIIGTVARINFILDSFIFHLTCELFSSSSSIMRFVRFTYGKYGFSRLRLETYPIYENQLCHKKAYTRTHKICLKVCVNQMKNYSMDLFHWFNRTREREIYIRCVNVYSVGCVHRKHCMNESRRNAQQLLCVKEKTG